jgi:hypothetical protein
MTIQLTPLQLGDIFDRTFKIVAKSFGRNIILILIFLGVPSVLLVLGLQAFYSMVGDAMQEASAGGGAGFKDFSIFVGAMLFIACVAVIYFLANLASKLAVTSIACGEINDRPLSWREALQRTLSKRFGRAVGQSLMCYLAMAGFFLFPFVLVFLGASTGSAFLGLVGVLAFFVTIPLAVMYWIRWTMALNAIAWEEQGVLGSFSRSEFLVKGQWWRVFGILLLLGVIVQFAVSLVSAPVMFIAMWDSFGEYFKLLSTMNPQKTNPELPLQILSSMGLGMGLTACLSAILTMLVEPAYVSVLYFDLRARTGEFSPEPEAGTPLILPDEI